MKVKTLFEVDRLVMFRGALPVLETVSDTVAELPTVTDPKLNDVGETPIRGAAGAVAVPDNATCTEGCDGSFPMMARVPDCAPSDVGLKRTLSCVEPPGFTLKGAAGPTV